MPETREDFEAFMRVLDMEMPTSAKRVRAYVEQLEQRASRNASAADTYKKQLDDVLATTSNPASEPGAS